MSKNAPKIILVVVCLGAAAALLFYNMSGSQPDTAPNEDGIVGTSAEETDALNEEGELGDQGVLQGLQKPNF